MAVFKPGSWRKILLGEQEEEKDRPVLVETRPNYLFSVAIVLEVLSLVAVCVLACLLRFSNIFPVLERNITEFCGYPNQIHTNPVYIIPEYAYYLVLLIIPISVIIICEIIHGTMFKEEDKIVVSVAGVRYPAFVRRIFRFISVFLLGLFLTSIIVDVSKLLIGKPRPLFITVYRDKYCGSAPASDQSINADEKKARMSFPCYHSAVAAYAAVYVIAYFHRVLQVRGTYTLRPIIATGLLILSLLPTYEHYITLKNDEFDIIVGFLCGIIISLYVTLGILGKFKEHPVKAAKPLNVNKLIPRPIRPYGSPYSDTYRMNEYNYYQYEDASVSSESQHLRNFNKTYNNQEARTTF